MKILFAAAAVLALGAFEAPAEAAPSRAAVAGPGRPIPYSQLQARTARTRTPAAARARTGLARQAADRARNDTPPTDLRSPDGVSNGGPAPGDLTAGRGGDMGLAPGSAQIGEAGAAAMGAGSTGGAVQGSMAPGLTAGAMLQTVNPPGSPPAR